MMALTREFKKTVFERAHRDPVFRNALLTESINEFLSGDLETAKSMLRDYINASVAFHNLAEKLNKNDKSLQRMLGPDGNPTTSNFFALLHGIQEIEGIKIEASCKSFMKRSTSRISRKGIATNKKSLVKKSGHR
jgi:DNA-binding phage protein